MAALVCAGERFLGFGQPVLLSEYDGEFERLVAVTALVGGTIGDQGISQVAPICRGSRVAGRCAHVMRLGGSPLAISSTFSAEGPS